jgi:hypothetical protein
MKKTLNTLLLLVGMITTSLNAQDIIVKKDGSIIKGKIAEIGEESVKYHKADNPDGPLYSLATANIASINYENGKVEKFSSSGSEPAATASKSEASSEETKSESSSSGSSSIMDNEDLKRSIESIARDVGEQVIRNCASGKVDNSSTEIYWDGVMKDAFTEEIAVPIIAKWKPKFTDGAGKWIKGKILIDKQGNKKWVYQNNGGLLFSDCAKTFRPR